MAGGEGAARGGRMVAALPTPAKRVSMAFCRGKRCLTAVVLAGLEALVGGHEASGVMWAKLSLDALHRAGRERHVPGTCEVACREGCQLVRYGWAAVGHVTHLEEVIWFRKQAM